MGISIKSSLSTTSVQASGFSHFSAAITRAEKRFLLRVISIAREWKATNQQDRTFMFGRNSDSRSILEMFLFLYSAGMRAIAEMGAVNLLWVPEIFSGDQHHLLSQLPCCLQAFFHFT